MLNKTKVIALVNRRILSFMGTRQTKKVANLNVILCFSMFFRVIKLNYNFKIEKRVPRIKTKYYEYLVIL